MEKCQKYALELADVLKVAYLVSEPDSGVATTEPDSQGRPEWEVRAEFLAQLRQEQAGLEIPDRWKVNTQKYHMFTQKN